MPQQWEMGQVLSNDQPLIYRQSAPTKWGRVWGSSWRVWINLYRYWCIIWAGVLPRAFCRREDGRAAKVSPKQGQTLEKV
jgi:hypothetical protein